MLATHHIKLIMRAVFWVLITAWLFLGLPSSFAQTADLSNPIYLPMIAHQFDPTWYWQQPQSLKLSPTPNTNDSILLTIDKAGLPRILFDTLYAPRFIYQTYPTAQGWITPTQIANTLGTSNTLFPPVEDDMGDIHLLWRNWLGTGVTNPYRLMYSRLVNGAWSAEEEVSRFNDETQGMVRLDPTGMLHVTSASTWLFGGIRHFTRTPSGWSSPIDLSLTHPTTWVWPDYFGGIHFYGEETYPQQTVIYSYWLDGTYRFDGQRIAGDLITSDSLLDGQNNLNLFKRDQVPVSGGTVYGVYHRCLTHDLTWTDEQVLSGQLDTSSPLVKAEDGHSQIVLAWQERSGNVVQIRVFEGCKLTHSSSIILSSKYTWELESVAIHQTPDILCLLARRMYTSTDYLIQCTMPKS
jgi:hypothetical protein